MNKTKQDLITQQIETFPPLPATVTNVLEVTNNPESSVNDLVKVILPDPSVCVNILKIANSALYGRPKKVSSIETAVIVLGFDEIKNIILGNAVVSFFQKLLGKNQEALDIFWDHSFTCGLAAKSLADHLNFPSGQFFIGGLIHDIGKLAMLMTFPDEYDPALWMEGFTTKEKLIDEKKSFSISHNTVGRRILQNWMFPDCLLVALECHHYPLNAPKYQICPLIIQLADLFAFFCCNPEEHEGKDLFSVVNSYLPELKPFWLKNNLPWVEISLESCFAWAKIDRAHGSSIMQIFASA